MAGGRASFEVQVLRDNHWVFEEERETEMQARALAKTIFAKRSLQGVRVVKNWRRADDVETGNVVYTEIREPEAPRVTIVPIEEAPFCRVSKEYYRLESRSTINRLFRKYIEQVYLTPTELIHNYKALVRVQETDTLFPAAVDRVATIQARSVGDEPQTRRDEVYRAVAQMTAKVRQAEQHPNLPRLKGNDFGRILTLVERFASPDEVAFYALVVLSRDLVERRNWLGKLDRLAALTHPEQKGQSLSLIDGVIADVVGVPSALQDVLGYQRNLGDALCAIADLSEGRFAADHSDARDQLQVIGPLLASGKLEETRKALMDRLFRELSSGQPLNRQDPSGEREAFRRVALRLFRHDGLYGGPRAAEALTRRFVFLQEAGGRTGLRQAVDGVLASVGDPLFNVEYLLDLATSPLAADLSSDILRHLVRQVGVDDIDALVPKGWAAKDKLLRMTRLYDTIQASRAFGAADRHQLLQAVDRTLSLYIQRQGVIERLDDPSALLRDRATRLLEFCAARVLPPSSKAQALARERVIALLRQPNFEEHFVAGITSRGAHEQALRSLHALLKRGGFK